MSVTERIPARLGAEAAPGGVRFTVWAPQAAEVAVRVVSGDELLERGEEGFWSGVVPAGIGEDYWFVLDGERLPDPASREQPHGLRGPSRVAAPPAVRPGPPLDLEQLVLYELHVGTFTPAGTFDAAIDRLPRLRDLGVTAIELMPVATFPGTRNWGYDGVYSSAPHPAYGGPEGLARLVDAAHALGLGVVLDVVYNHIGPGSEAIAAFGPYFTDCSTTFWGDALDYRERGVREWAIQNAELWVRDYRVDGLRLDAVHAIHDDSDVHVLRELRDRVKAIDPSVLVISEQSTEDFRSLEEWGHDAMWFDSLHHELHVLLTGERDGYYREFGTMDGLVRELTRERPEGFVVCAQNHDQVGNRPSGDRLPPDAHRVALAVVLFSLSVPLLLMGEEHHETAPFAFFTDHVDPAIAEATREGRRREFESFTGFAADGIPDPQSRQTFLESKLPAELPEPDPIFRRLLELRRTLPRELSVEAEGPRLVLRRGGVRLVADLEAKTVELG